MVSVLCLYLATFLCNTLTHTFFATIRPPLFTVSSEAKHHRIIIVEAA